MTIHPAPRDTKVVLCVQFHFSFWRIPPELPQAIRERWPQMRVVHLTSYDALAAELPDADIFVGFTLQPDQLAVAQKLKWIHVTAAGVSQLMRPDVRERNITITNSRGIHAIPMAEHTLGLLISLARKFPAAHRFQAKQQWSQQEILDLGPTELRGATLLIVGFGAIGSEVARLAKAFGMKVWAVTRTGRADPLLAERVFPAADLDRALADVDYVVLAAPETPGTHHMIGEAQLDTMKRSSYLINVARGSLIDEAALIKALQNKTIAGAALDVAAVEPLPPEDPLWRQENLMITPHTSSVSNQLWPRQTKLLLGNLQRWFDGRELLNLVELGRGY